MDVLLIPLLLISGIALLLLSIHGLPSLPAPVQEAADRSARRFASTQEAAARQDLSLRSALGRLEGRVPLHLLPLHDPLVLELLRELGEMRLEIDELRTRFAGSTPEAPPEAGRHEPQARAEAPAAAAGPQYAGTGAVENTSRRRVEPARSG